MTKKWRPEIYSTSELRMALQKAQKVTMKIAFPFYNCFMAIGFLDMEKNGTVFSRN